MLPIMTFDPAQLSPSLGYVFDPRWLDPFESVVGMLWKFARANGVAGHIVVGQLTDKPVDVYVGVAPTVDEIAVPRPLPARRVCRYGDGSWKEATPRKRRHSRAREEEQQQRARCRRLFPADTRQWPAHARRAVRS